MLSAFKLDNRRLSRLELDDSDDLTSSLWVDLVEPEEGERERVQNELGQSLATRPELDDIEASARFFEDEDGLHIHSFFYFEDAEDHAGNSTVAFTIRDGRLYTLRERELPAFRLYRMRARNQTMLEGNAYELLLDLFETKIEQLADEIENIYSDLEKLSRVIMEGHQGDEYDAALSTLAELEDIGWKVRLCLMDTQRALNFLVRKARLPTGQLEQAREVLRDIESLLPHNESLFQKVNFLRDYGEDHRELGRAYLAGPLDDGSEHLDRLGDGAAEVALGKGLGRAAEDRHPRLVQPGRVRLPGRVHPRLAGPAGTARDG